MPLIVFGPPRDVVREACATLDLIGATTFSKASERILRSSAP